MVGLMCFLGLVCACCGGYSLYARFASGLSADEINFSIAMYKEMKRWGETFSASEDVAMFFMEHCYTFLIAAAVLLIAAFVIKKLRDMYLGSNFQEYLEYQKSKRLKNFYEYRESKHSSSMLSNALKQKESDEADKGIVEENTFFEDYWVCGKCKSRIPKKFTVCKYCGHSKW